MAYDHVDAVSPSIDGVAVALTAPAAAGPGNGDAVPVGSVLLVDNGSGADLTVTLKAAHTYLGHTLSDTTVTVPTGETALIGPILGDPFGVQSGADINRVHVEYGSVTGVTRAVLAGV